MFRLIGFSQRSKNNENGGNNNDDDKNRHESGKHPSLILKC